MAPGRIARRYLRSWFFLDLPVVSLDWVMLLAQSDGAGTASDVSKSFRTLWRIEHSSTARRRSRSLVARRHVGESSFWNEANQSSCVQICRYLFFAERRTTPAEISCCFAELRRPTLAKCNCCAEHRPIPTNICRILTHWLDLGQLGPTIGHFWLEIDHVTNFGPPPTAFGRVRPRVVKTRTTRLTCDRFRPASVDIGPESTTCGPI